MTRIPTCTYRLQFNRWFTFSQAREIVPYLDALGISDVYASPYFQASPDSLHGYDITDHNKLNGAIGSREDYEAWVGALHAHAMGQILDFVPNHVGIAEPIQNASRSAFVKRKSSSDVWNAVARKRRKSNRQLKRRSSRSMGSPATRAALMRWINCSTRSLIGWRFGESPQRKLITAVFLM